MPTNSGDARRRPAAAVLDEIIEDVDRIGAPVKGADPLAWDGYDQLRRDAAESSGTDESVIAAVGPVVGAGGDRAVVVAWEFDHLGGSMGADAGRRIADAYDLARERRLPIVLAPSTGGARMQEGMASLVQMAGTTVAARQHARSGLLQVALLRHPTTGGVFASHANLADVILAESGATIGFAGPRVAEALTGGALPEHSHTARGAVAAGLADHLVDPGAGAAAIAALVSWAADVERTRRDGWGAALTVPTQPLDGLLAREDPAHVDAWQAVLASRSPERAKAGAWLARLDVAMELHGDRAGADDPTLRVALARLAGAPVVVVAIDRATDEGRITPAGYRKAWRGFELAARLDVPLVTLVDTAGAQASAASEAGGIAHHIAETFARLLELPCPTITVVTGEGGSGGALALAAADRLLMLEHSTFSVIAPEGAAAILHRDAFRAPEVAGRLKPDAHTLHRLGIADQVITEQGDPVANGWDAVAHGLADLTSQDAQARVRSRQERWRSAPSAS